jgi:acyl-CoA reductase-like NAD-dependent aldehyde dehydrogenase
MCLCFSCAQFLAELGIGAVNPGFYNGTWGGSGAVATAVNPANGKPIATVQQATVEEYEACLAAMVAAQEAWQLVRVRTGRPAGTRRAAGLAPPFAS